jgi:hypothetical protein
MIGYATYGSTSMFPEGQDFTGYRAPSISRDEPEVSNAKSQIVEERSASGPSGWCGDFFDCVGLDVDCKTQVRSDGFTQKICAVNGGEFAFVGSAICGNVTQTAGRFGVPWSKAMTAYSNARAGDPCTYDPADTIQEGSGQEGRAPGSALSRTRGSATQPNQPLSGRLLFDTLQRVCSIPWGANYADLSPEKEACLARVKADFRRRGYNWESIKCKGADGEGMLECTPVFIPIEEQTGDYRRDVAVTTDSPIIDTPVGDSPAAICAARGAGFVYENGQCTEYVDDSDGRVNCDPRCTSAGGGCVSPADCQALLDADAPSSVPAEVDPETGQRFCPSLYPFGRIDNLDQLICWSDDPDAWRRNTTPANGSGVPVPSPGASVGDEPGNGGQFFFGEPAGGGGSFWQDFGGNAVDLATDEWIDGVPNWATLAMAATAGVLVFRGKR